MKKVVDKKVFLSIPITLLVVYFCAGIFFNPAYIIYIKPFIIPTFILFVAYSNSKLLTLNYLLFVILFYISETLILFWEDSVTLFRTALIASFFCYSALINLGYNAIKGKNIYSRPTGFSLFILILNGLLLLAILYIITTAINDYLLNIIIVFNTLVTVFLGTTAVIYLSKFANTKAYFYFFGVFALIFNDIFAAIGTYFIENSILNTSDRILHFGSFILVYLFVLQENKKVDNLEMDYQP